MSDKERSFLSRLAMLFGASPKAPKELIIHPVPGDVICFDCYP